MFKTRCCKFLIAIDGMAIMDQIRTQSVARGVADASPLIIAEASKTRIVFEPRIHGTGVRGILIRQNKNQEGAWSDTSEIDFRNAAPDITVSIPLKTSGLKHLYDFLTELYLLQSNGVERGQHDYVVAKKEEIVITNLG